MEPIIACGRSGNLFPPGAIFQHQGAILTVISSTRQNTYGQRGSPECPYDDCWRTVTIHARPATPDEAAAFLREEAERRARREWSDALRQRRHEAWLAKRAIAETAAEIS